MLSLLSGLHGLIPGSSSSRLAARLCLSAFRILLPLLGGALGMLLLLASLLPQLLLRCLLRSGLLPSFVLPLLLVFVVRIIAIARLLLSKPLQRDTRGATWEQLKTHPLL